MGLWHAQWHINIPIRILIMYLLPWIQMCCHSESNNITRRGQRAGFNVSTRLTACRKFLHDSPWARVCKWVEATESNPFQALYRYSGACWFTLHIPDANLSVQNLDSKNKSHFYWEAAAVQDERRPDPQRYNSSEDKREMMRGLCGKGHRPLYRLVESLRGDRCPPANCYRTPWPSDGRHEVWFEGRISKCHATFGYVNSFALDNHLIWIL